MQRKTRAKWIKVDAFIAFPDNPRQRDTELHAKKAVKYLSRPEPTHHCVDAVEFPDGTFMKADAHTRAHLWGLRRIPRPPDDKVLCTFHPVENVKEAMALYGTFDSTDAVENATDKIAGACRQHSIELSSKLLANYQFGSALRLLSSISDPYKLVAKFKKSIVTVDSWALPQSTHILGKNRGVHSAIKAFAIGAVDASLLTDDIKEFVSKVIRDEGTCVEGKRDAAAWGRYYWQDRIANNQIAGYTNATGLMDDLAWSFMVSRARSKGSKTTQGCWSKLVKGEL